LNTIDSLGRIITNNLLFTWELFRLAYLSTRAALFHQAQGMRTIFSVVSSQVYFTGFQALPLISILSIATGSVLILQASSNLNIFGGGEFVGNLLVVVIVRELGPLMTALVVISRSGTAVATEVGNMRANNEITALETLGINPLSFVVFPRMLGGLVSVICLSFYFVMIAIFGGYLITQFINPISFEYFVGTVLDSLAKEDLFLFLLKSAFSGTVIFAVSCYQGLQVKRSPTEVPVVTTQAVLKSMTYVVLFNALVTSLFYLYRLTSLGFL
jgi:phospholipid/cholesterol/gamma-HCH transport system permease protein